MMQHRPCSGSSGRSTRSRRDDVWEKKRQRWLQNGGSGGGGGSGCTQQRRPPQLGDMSGLSAAAPPGPKSPLSRLMAEGYSQPAMQQPPQQQQPYYGSGDKPLSQGSGRSIPSIPSTGGFDANTAGQWNANVASEVANRQGRHDPSISGPPKSHSGQRISQPSGGNSNIDLSWGGSAGGAPPRMPGSGGSGQAGAQYGGQQGMNYGAQAYADPRHARGQSPAQGRSGSACPFGRDEYAAPTPARGMSGQGTPYGTDSMQQMHPTSMRSGSRGPRGASPSPQQYSSYGGSSPSPHGGFHGGDGMAAGRGRAGGLQPPGGRSNVVFG